jgi:hypothetical protein
MERSASIELAQKVLSLAAVFFGLITIIAGINVLVGSDPGYNVILPLLLCNNTAMGIVYIAAGIFTWVDLRRGKSSAGAIFISNV